MELDRPDVGFELTVSNGLVAGNMRRKGFTFAQILPRVLSGLPLDMATVNMREFVLNDIFRFVRTGTEPDGTILGEFRATGYLPSFLDEFITYGLVDDGDYL